jgi:outer membrane protein assembly factor BamE (lipoprotein component of BamABCDE complex)
MKLLLSIAIIALFNFTGCNTNVNLKNFDEEKWIKDSHGCNLDRLSMMESLDEQTDELKGLNQDEIIMLLGKPDQNELYKRNQKFFIYYITPKNCEKKKYESYTYLSIRFNATGLAKEVIIYSE